MQGQGVSKDAAAGLANLQKACGGKDGWACYRLGKMHLAGEGVAKDRTKASDEFAQACAADYKPACGM
jgi:TPR repeat protein